MRLDAVDAVGLTPEERAEALIKGAHGVPYLEAAVRLLVEHGTWLERDDFAHFIELDGPDNEGEFVARVSWRRVQASLQGRPEPGDTILTSSGPASRILAIAASFGGGMPVDLRDVTSHLAPADSECVLDAVRRAVEVG